MHTALVLRPALPLDRAAILTLSRDIWDGGDYLPFVLDDWLADQDSLFLVGEFGPRLATVARATRQLPDEWWFEGMRVHPDFEGHGFASRGMRYLMRYAANQGARRARLVTSSQRLAVHRICAQEGWQRIAEVAHYRAPALPAAVSPPFSQVNPAEIAEAARLVAGWQDQKTFNGMMDLGWEFVRVNSIHLTLAIQEQRAWWWIVQGQRRGLLTIWFNEERQARELKLELAACAPGDLAALLRDYRRLASHLGQAEAGGNLAVLDGMAKAAQAAGFERNWEKSLYVFEVIF